MASPHSTAQENSVITKNGVLIKPAQLVHVSEKEWGHEEWIANSPGYCGKKLVFNKGYQCSMHHHKIKDETFYIQSGKIVLETDHKDKTESRVMTAGDTAHIVPGMWHRIIAITNSEVFEFSTLHMEDDSYRRATSGKVDLKALGFEK